MALLWERYIQLTEIEAVFRALNSDLSLRPIFHQLEHRVDAHIFVAFLAHCLMGHSSKAAAGPRSRPDSAISASEALYNSAARRVDPDHRRSLPRHAPLHAAGDGTGESDQKLGLRLPAQRPPRIHLPGTVADQPKM
ncbi:MAG: hypothetical protein EHM23_33455 [Acidobacteria bacterium]|nr:MAG: hypothetical protein EHM23_33455 [Acidobacteriota bacterium]